MIFAYFYLVLSGSNYENTIFADESIIKATKIKVTYDELGEILQSNAMAENRPTNQRFPKPGTNGLRVRSLSL